MAYFTFSVNKPNRYHNFNKLIQFVFSFIQIIKDATAMFFNFNNNNNNDNNNVLETFFCNCFFLWLGTVNK